LLNLINELRAMYKHLTLFSLFTVSTALASTEQLTLYTEVFPPYNFMQHNQLTGINTKIMESLCEKAKLNCTFNVLPWKRGMSLTMSQPHTGIYSTSRTAKREKQFYWVGPLVSGHSCLYRLNERNDIKVSSTKSLQNYTIGVSRGDVYQTVLADFNLTEGQHFLTYSKKFEELKMFKQGKHDLLIGSSLTLTSQLMNVGMSPQQVTPVFELKHPALVGNYLALNKNTSPEVVTVLQKALDSMKQENQIAAIIDQFVAGNINSTGETSPVAEQCLNGSAIY
tara:strand:- start:618 stop:1460 length:843 start_codon:yes stop_codon:yes gene_type:complete